MKKSGQQIMTDLAHKAMDTFQQNSDTLVAGFLVRHPDVDPADVQLVFQSVGGVMRFSLELRELHVPAAKALYEYDPDEDAESVSFEQGLVAGWNDCRDAMLQRAKSAIAPDATVISLQQQVDTMTLEPASAAPQTDVAIDETVDTFMANLRRAVNNHELVSIGGGVFNPEELAAILTYMEVARG